MNTRKYNPDPLTNSTYFKTVNLYLLLGGNVMYEKDTVCYDYDHPKKIFIILTHLTVLLNAEVKIFLKGR